MTTLLLNFAHPLTAAQLAQTAVLTGQAPRRVIDLPVQFDPGQPFLQAVRDASRRERYK